MYLARFLSNEELQAFKKGKKIMPKHFEKLCFCAINNATQVARNYKSVVTWFDWCQLHENEELGYNKLYLVFFKTKKDYKTIRREYTMYGPESEDVQLSQYSSKDMRILNVYPVKKSNFRNNSEEIFLKGCRKILSCKKDIEAKIWEY